MIGENITCYAEGNPEPEIRWTNLDDPGVEVHGPTVQVDELALNRSTTYQCQACNRIHDNTQCLQLDKTILTPKVTTGKGRNRNTKNRFPKISPSDNM